MRLAGKKALITGAASGIGKAVVAAFLREGAEVIGADKDFPVVGPGTGDGGSAVCLDVSKESDWERLFQGVINLDVLVACAGISEAKSIPETSLADWRRVMGVNLDGAFLSVKYGVKAMRATRRKCVLREQSGLTDVGEDGSSGIQISSDSGELCFPCSGRHADVEKNAVLAGACRRAWK
jgi:3(or 17)beta-hydroxysteroid dehydrogenase